MALDKPNPREEMRPSYNEEAESYRQKIQAFLGEHLPPNWGGLGALDENSRDVFIDEGAPCWQTSCLLCHRLKNMAALG